MSGTTLPPVLEVGQAAELARRFGVGTGARLSGPVARGELGQVWRLETSLGTWAVKEPFERPADDEVREHAAYQDAVRAAGVPVPAVMRTVDGDVLADLGTAQVRLFEWVDLRPRDDRLDPRRVGGLVAAIHRVRFDGELPVDPWYTEPVGADRWDGLVRELRRAEAPFAEGLAQLRDELVGLEGWLEAPTRLQTCHRDLWADNVLSTAAGGLCVIDWENAGLADPGQELCLVLFEFGWGSPDRPRRLYQAYLDGGGPGRVRGRGDFSMVIAQLGHLGERAFRGWLDPAASEHERAHQAELVEEFVSRPLTRAVVDGLLEAIGGVSG